MKLYVQRFCKFSPALKELRIQFCQKGQASSGTREFVAKHYPEIKKKNLNIPILIRECEGIQPLLWARYEKGKETSISLTNISAEDIKKQLSNLGNAK